MMADRLPPIETDPLGAIRKELIGAAWRQKARADRRRRMLTVVSTLLLTFVCVAGGAAAIGVELPLIGDTLEGLVAGRQDAERKSASGKGDPTLPNSPADLAPGPDRHSEPVAVPWGEDGTAVGAGYLNRQGDVCFLFVRPDGDAAAAGCTAPSLIADRLDSGVVFLQDVTHDGLTVVKGFVAADVTRLEVRGPEGRLQARIGDPWRPGGAGVPMRPFVAVTSGGGRVDDRTLNIRNYSVEAHLPDGRTLTVEP